MNHYKNILVAIDFSGYGVDVIQKAKHLTEQFNAQLSIIHVLDNIPMPDTPYGATIPLNEVSPYELLELEKNKFIQICDQFDIEPTHRWLVWGEPQQEITRIATQERIDLIIVVSHGRHGLAALFMGSTAKDVLYHAECDVLAVHLKNHKL